MRKALLVIVGLVIGFILVGVFAKPGDQATPPPATPVAALRTSVPAPTPAPTTRAPLAAAPTAKPAPTARAPLAKPRGAPTVFAQGVASAASPACDVVDIKPDSENIKVWSADRQRYLVNQKDANGIYQMYMGTADSSELKCISCGDKPDGPLDRQNKLQFHWYPLGDWIIVGVEFANHSKPFPVDSLNEGILLTGAWLDIYATDYDGTHWYNLTNWDPNQVNAFTGVPFTPDGKTGVYARMVDNNIFKYKFGRWELYSVNFVVDANGVPSFRNTKNITPRDTYWVEPGDFSSDGKYVLLSADTGLKDPQGQDQFVMDIATGEVTNVTNTPDVWDEHGVFAPNGLILFMSSYPYPGHGQLIGLKTEFMLMNIDGSELRQLTHFLEPGYTESTPGDSLAEVGAWSADGSYVTVWQLLIGKNYPNHATWRITFRGNCGGDGAYN